MTAGPRLAVRLDPRGIAVLGLRPPVPAGPEGAEAATPAVPAAPDSAAAPWEAMTQALREAAADPALRAIVLLEPCCASPAPPRAEAEIAAPPPDSPAARAEAEALEALCSAAEAASVPVIAALDGLVSGPGVALALAAHYRIASRRARLRFGEVRQGLVPAAGVTQRLPRLLGAAKALELLVEARPLSASAPEAAELVDLVANDDLRADALAFAQQVLDLGLGPRPSRGQVGGFADPIAYQAAVSQWRARLGVGPLIAPARIVACVEAAQLLPFDAGCAFERDAAEECRASPEVAALAHLRRAEGRAATDFSAEPPVAAAPASSASPAPRAAPGPARRMALLGGIGPYAPALADAALRAGLQVVYFAPDAAGLEEGETRLAELRQSQGSDRGGAPQPRMTLDPADLAGADLVVEATGASPAARSALLEALKDDLPRGALRASLLRTDGAPGTDPAAMLRALARAGGTDGAEGGVTGLRLFPGQRQGAPLAEILPPEGADEAALARWAAVLRRMGRQPLRAGGPGLVVPLQNALFRAALGLLSRGAAPARIDSALARWGWAAAPCAAMDRLGLGRLAARLAPADPQAAEALEALVAAGRTGRTGGAGLYDWPEGGGAPQPAPPMALVPLRRGEAHPPRRDEGICQRVLAALANAGAALLREGHAARPSDIDLAAVCGLGFPRWRGGPMEGADLAGLFTLQRSLTRYAEEDAALYTPEAIFGELVKNGRDFEWLNSGGHLDAAPLRSSPAAS